MRVAPLILLAACYRSGPEPVTTPIANRTDAPATEALKLSRDGLGPIDGTTTATLVGLRRLLAGYEVRPVNDGSLEYDIYKDGERLAYVVPDDQSGYVFNIHAVSSRIAVVGHPWRVGAAFSGASRLTHCECWGPNPTCYTDGEHIAVNFDRECTGLTDGDADRRALRVLDGVKIQRVIWSPVGFGESSGEDMD